MAESAMTTGEGLLLSYVAGAVDGIGYVLLRVFTAHITGNTVHVGTDVGRADLASAWRPALAIVAFVAGVALGALVREACLRAGWPARATVMGLSCALLVSFVAVGLGTAGTPGAARLAFLASVAALAMGGQNAIMPRIARRRVKTYITGTMTEFAEAVVAALTGPAGGRAGALRRARGLLALWVTYLVGGIVSGAAGSRWGASGALVAIAGLVVAIALELRRWRAGEALGARALT